MTPQEQDHALTFILEEFGELRRCLRDLHSRALLLMPLSTLAVGALAAIAAPIPRRSLYGALALLVLALALSRLQRRAEAVDVYVPAPTPPPKDGPA